MISLSSLYKRRPTLRMKLFGYMFLLAVSLFLFLMAGIFLIGGFTQTKTKIANTMQFQMNVFERQIETHFDELSVMNIYLSYQTQKVIEKYLAENNIGFSDLNGSARHIEALQKELLPPLYQKLWEADCTGAFIVLEATVKPDAENADSSKTGLYLQKGSVESRDNRVILYRGLPSVGKPYDVMPHRRWMLEFSDSRFPHYNEFKNTSEFQISNPFRVTDVTMLPGTDQNVILLTVPLFDKKGEFLGLCGFEINEAYFKKVFAQPSELDHAAFCLSSSETGLLQTNKMLSAGVIGKYYLEPKAPFEVFDFGDGLTAYKSENASYIGMSRQVSLRNACTLFISALIPVEDYYRLSTKDTLGIVTLIIVFLLSASGMAFYFSHRYIQPLKRSIAEIKKKEYGNRANQSTDITDLFTFLAEQDRINEKELAKAEQERTMALLRLKQMQTKFEEASQQIARLAYSRKTEVDPYDYENFKQGLRRLTARENEVLALYISGKSVKDIIELTGMKESTVRFHNRNLYSKLGVHSLKQLLRYISIMNQEERNSGTR